MAFVQKIRIEPLAHWPALLMTWSLRPSREEISEAFQVLLELLNQSSDSLFLVVDLRQNLRFPISDTVHHALEGVYTHLKLRQVLVIGGNSQARAVGNILRKITGLDKIIWFKDDEDCCEFLKQTFASNGH